jgi:hypothetical protein
MSECPDSTHDTPVFSWVAVGVCGVLSGLSVLHAVHRG